MQGGTSSRLSPALIKAEPTPSTAPARLGLSLELGMLGPELGLELRVLGHRQQHQGQVMVGGNHPHLALKSGWFSLCWAWLEQRAAAKLSGFGS